jgi:hypothetical protein
VSQGEDVRGTQPVRFVDQKAMESIFAVVDEAGLSREAIRVPLVGAGQGHFEKGSDGVWTIVIPARGSLEGFLVRLREALAAEAGG